MQVVDMRRYSVDEFIELTKNEPYNWINYCEIMILQSGLIVLARPSHQECAIYIEMESEGKSREEIVEELRKEYLSPLDFYVDKYKLVAVWYEQILVSSSQRLNRFQERTLKKLESHGLISKNITVCYADEYTNYLRRKELFGSEILKEEG